MIRIGVDKDGCIGEWNSEAEAMSGYTRDEVLGRNFLNDLLTRDVRDAMAERICYVLMGQLVPHGQLAFYTKAGARADLQIAMELTWNSTKKVHDVILSGRLSESKGGLLQPAADRGTERADFKRNPSLEDIATGKTIAVGLEGCNPAEDAKTDKTIMIGLDQDGHVCKWSEAAEAMSGFRRSEVLGLHFVDVLLDPEGKDVVAESICYAWMGQQVRDVLVPFYTKCGCKKDLFLTTTVQWSKATNSHHVVLMGGFEASRSSNTICVDAQGRIIHWGLEFCAATGFTAKEVLGLSLVDDIIAPSASQLLAQTLGRALQGPSVHELVLPILAKCGVKKWFTVHVDRDCVDSDASGATLVLTEKIDSDQGVRPTRKVSTDKKRGATEDTLPTITTFADERQISTQDTLPSYCSEG